MKTITREEVLALVPQEAFKNYLDHTIGKLLSGDLERMVDREDKEVIINFFKQSKNNFAVALSAGGLKAYPSVMENIDINALHEAFLNSVGMNLLYVDSERYYTRLDDLILTFDHYPDVAVKLYCDWIDENSYDSSYSYEDDELDKNFTYKFVTKKITYE